MNQLIPGFPTPKIDQYKVYVQSITYNQSKYIEECLNGVLMQKTDFPLVHQVVDDCSTDGEQEVIKSWIEKNCDLVSAEYYDNDLCTITLATAKDNPNYTIAAYFLKKNMYGNPKKNELFAQWREVCSYEALCEGDDYWIDSNKLQKQVEFLECHNDYSICIHNAMSHWEDGSHDDVQFSDIKTREYTYKDKMFRDFIMPTASVVVRTSVVNSDLFKKIFSCKHIIVGDWPLLLVSAALGKVYGMVDCMSVYRRVSEGFSLSKGSDWRVYNRQAAIMNLEFYDIMPYPYKIPCRTKYIMYNLGLYSRSKKMGKVEYIGLWNAFRRFPLNTIIYLVKMKLLKLC